MCPLPCFLPPMSFEPETRCSAPTSTDKFRFDYYYSCWDYYHYYYYDHKRHYYHELSNTWSTDIAFSYEKVE